MRIKKFLHEIKTTYNPKTPQFLSRLYLSGNVWSKIIETEEAIHKELAKSIQHWLLTKINDINKVKHNSQIIGDPSQRLN